MGWIWKDLSQVEKDAQNVDSGRQVTDEQKKKLATLQTDADQQRAESRSFSHKKPFIFEESKGQGVKPSRFDLTKEERMMGVKVKSLDEPSTVSKARNGLFGSNKRRANYDSHDARLARREQLQELSQKVTFDGAGVTFKK